MPHENISYEISKVVILPYLSVYSIEPAWLVLHEFSIAQFIPNCITDIRCDIGANMKCLHVRWISVDSDAEPLWVLCSRPSSNCNFRSPLLRRQVHVNPKIYTKRVNMPRFWNSLLHIRTVVMEKINIGMRVWTRTFILRNSTFFGVLTSLRIVSELLIKFKNRFSV